MFIINFNLVIEKHVMLGTHTMYVCVDVEWMEGKGKEAEKYGKGMLIVG